MPVYRNMKSGGKKKYKIWNGILAVYSFVVCLPGSICWQQPPFIIDVLQDHKSDISSGIDRLGSTTLKTDVMLDKSNSHTCENLKIDEACLTIQSTVSNPLTLWTQSSECEGCPVLFQTNITSGGNVTLKVNSSTETNVTLTRMPAEDVFCSQLYSFGEFGNYLMEVGEDKRNNKRCSIIITKEPVNIYIPILVAIVVYLSLAVFWCIGKFLYRHQVFQRLFRNETQEIDSYGEREDTQLLSPPQKQRLRSLDTVRGVAIVIMIFVNYKGGGYYFFHHARWNGLTVADVVFPWFMWIMGTSLALTMRSLLRKSVPRRRIFRNILKRSCTLFALGIILNTYGGKNNLEKLRIPGVLQRFGICYFVVASIHLIFAKPNDTHQHEKWAPVRDIFLYWGEWLSMFVILVIHILLTFLLAVPGCPRGYLGPGGLHSGGEYFNCTGGAAGYIDRIVLGESHMYQHPTAKVIYLTDLPYDPEGILGFLTSIFLVFLGLQAGKILLTYQEWKPRIIRWLIWGAVIGLIAITLCKGSKNDGWIPINKNLWSISYIFATGGMAFLLLSTCYFVIDVKKWWTGAPFYFPGMNSILLYVGHSLTGELFPWSWQVGQTHWEHLLVDLWGVTLWVIISIWLYYQKVFLTV
ncbi:heparan-alpha-glucosaminide N-acetyltransferase-like isoform X1 [Tachypleus tridentatus]|uniref:heparan-alpha-glucosaminide N-acetyltransferase-like isoform X1 n=1 Tax=Tachypleus tridentatus TaxID=6853 RepID=UPI003FD28AE1